MAAHGWKDALGRARMRALTDMGALRARAQARANTGNIAGTGEGKVGEAGEFGESAAGDALPARPAAGKGEEGASEVDDAPSVRVHHDDQRAGASEGKDKAGEAGEAGNAPPPRRATGAA